MAIAEQPRGKAGAARLAERDPQVYHPLDRLRGIIRRYVVIEGLLSAVLFVAAWFALGLLFDYGLFKTLGWDWVRDGSWWVRFLALAVALSLFAGILIFRIARRLATEFSYPSLALVLERKFPKVLGDRLITAVEMADVEAMGRFGYSKDMIRATIAEARERVGKVPVNDVFNWKRLWSMGFLTVGILVGTLVFAFAAFAIATRSADAPRFGWRFAHVSGIFLERNVALQDTPWPRRAHVELVGFPEGEMTIGRDAPPPRITARAYRWVIADRGVPEGWRPMLWSDVTESFVGRRVPELPFASLRVSGDTSPLPTEASAWTVDTVENLAFDKENETLAPEVAAMRNGLKTQMGDSYAELQEVFKALAEKADQPSMGRTLRKLEVPGEVSYKYSGRRTAGGGTLTPQQNSEFAGEIAGLKEDVDFVVRAGDFETSPRRIRLIPPPTLKGLYRTQYEPAYLHHAAPQGEGDNWLKGKKQLMARKSVSLTGERSIFVVPSGTELVLTAEADDPEKDPLKTVFATPVVGKFPGAKRDAEGRLLADPVPLAITGNGEGFAIEFKGTERLTENVEFKLTFANKYDVATTRSVLIQVAQDQPPTVEVAVDTIRKSGNVYLVTPLARIPFNPDSFVKDDHGLSKLEYVFTYWGEDSDVVRGIRAKYALRSLLDSPGHGPMMLPATLMPRLHADNFRFLDKGDDRLTAAAGLSEFLNQQSRLRRDTRERLEQLFGSPMGDESAPETVKRLELKNADRDYFDLRELNQLKVIQILALPGDPQPQYRMDLNIQATDNNVDNDTGPRVTRNAEPIRLKIISEGDLLVEIGKEEEQLGTRLDEALAKLAAAKKKYEFVRNTNGYKDESPEQVDAVKVRSQDALQDVEKARDIVQNVVREDRRIHRECQINRVNDATTHRYGKMANWMDRLLGENVTPVNDEEAKQVARGEFVPETTFPEAQNLLNNVQNQLNAGRWAPLAAVSDAEMKLYALERSLKKIREARGEAPNKQKLISRMREIIEKGKKARKDIDDLYYAYLARLGSREPVLGEAGAQFLVKGEAKKIKHTIAWLQYPNDNLKVKVAASDASIVVPAELTLNFEKDTVGFEYEIRAGTKEGVFKVTLTPEVGKPVEVQVTVK